MKTSTYCKVQSEATAGDHFNSAVFLCNAVETLSDDIVTECRDAIKVEQLAEQIRYITQEISRHIGAVLLTMEDED